MDTYKQLIEANRDTFVHQLYPLLEIPSISAENPEGVRQCCDWLVTYLEQDLGATVTCVAGTPLPFIVAELGSDPTKPTVLIYGHYDVQPVDPIERWHSAPFVPEIRDGRIYGRGTGDNKAQFFAHFKAILLLKQVEGSLPVNFKFLLDPTEEIGSLGIDEFLNANAHLLKADVVYNADGPVHESGLPTLWFGVKGNIFVDLSIKVSRRDAHSQYAALIPSAAWELIHTLGELRDRDGTVLLPGFYDDIVPSTPKEKDLLTTIPDSTENIQREFAVRFFNGPTDRTAVEKIMFDPTFNITGMTSGYVGDNRKTVLPSQASVKLDIRLVPNQDPDTIFASLKQFMIERVRGEVDIRLQAKTYPSRTPVENPYCTAAIEALQGLGQELVVLPSIGASNPSHSLTKFLGIPIVNAAYANADASNHAPNENIAIDYYLGGILQSIAVFKAFGAVKT